MPDLKISILGSVSAEVDGQRASLGGHRQRTLLSSLVVRCGHAVPVDVLIDDMWGDDPPRTARNSIQRFVSDIRSALGDTGDRLETVDGGYRLRVDADDVDGTRFETLLRNARAASGPDEASELFERALALWSGRPFEGVDSGATSTERVRLEELHAIAEEGWAQSLIDLGRHAEAVPELERMVAEAPYREERWSLLMVGLYRSGRQAEALGAFRKARATLVEELGIDPSADLVELEERILHQDPTLRAPPPSPGQAETTAVGNPYKGLEAFTASDADHFFGREELTELLTRRLAQPGLTAVVGPSGSGKSSVVRAGLIPAIEAGAHPGSDTWPIIVTHPGSHPFEELANASRAVFRPQLEASPHAPPLRVLGGGSHSPPEGTEPATVASTLIHAAEATDLVIVVDQFEELFVLSSEQARVPFMDMLATLASSARVVITLRADYYDRPLAHRDLSRVMATGLETVVPLSAAELERAITRPADALGVSFDPALVAEIIDDVGDQPAALPLLQYALTEVFEDRSSDTITVDDYDRVGGVAGALTARAEEVWRVLNDSQRQMARLLLLRLVAVSDAGAITRRTMPLTYLDTLDDPAAATETVDALVASRLVSIDRELQTRIPVLDVAHEALLTEWTRLRGWVEEEAENLRSQRRLEQAAHEWEAADRDPSFLLTGSRLARLDEWQTESGLTLSAGERGYLEASQDARRAEQALEQQRRDRELELERRSVRRLRLLAGVMAVAVVLAAGLTAFAVVQQRQAETRSAELSVQAVAATALSEVDSNPELSLLLAIEAARVSRDRLGAVLPVAEDALHTALAAPQSDVSFAGGSAIDYSPDGAMAAVARGDGSIELFAAETLESISVLAGHDGRVTHVAFSPDGRLLASASADATVRLWDVETGLFLTSLSHEARVSDVAWSPDGTRILTATGAAAVLWDVAAGEAIDVVNLNTNPVLGAFVGWVSDRIAVGAALGSLTIWDVDTGSILAKDVRLTHEATCALAVDPGTQTVYLGDLQGGVQRVTVTPSDDGGYQAAAETRSVPHEGEVCALDAGPGGLWAHAGADGRIMVHDVNDVLVRSVTHGGPVSAIALLPDGADIASTGLERGGVTRVWTVDAGSTGELDQFEVVSPLVGVSIRDGWVAAIGFDGAIGGGGIVTRSLVDDSATMLELDLAPGAISIGAMGTIAYGASPGLVEIRDPDGAVRELRDLRGNVDFLQFNSDGTRLLGAGGDAGDVVLWDVEEGSVLGELVTTVPIRFPLPRPAAAVDAVNDTFVVVEDGESAVIRSMADGDEISRFRLDDSAYLSVAIEPGTVALGSDTDEVALWETETGTRTMQLPAASAVAMAFVPGADRLITGGADGTLVMWDTIDGTELFRLPGSTQNIEEVRVSSDGAVAVVGDVGGTVRVLALAPELLLETAESRATRSLTEAECRSYLGLAECPD